MYRGLLTSSTQGETTTIVRLVRRCPVLFGPSPAPRQRRLWAATKLAAGPLMVGTLAELVRGRSDLLVENILLRQQLIIVRRSAKRPHCTATGPCPARAAHQSLGRLASDPVRRVQPETILRWYRDLFRWV